jgi:16S rRNA (adenine1518-N6/adenine1519-N6)-dimethyltransferase
MVQREVADRIAAKPGSRDYALLSATAQLYTRVEKLFTLPPGAFSPPPKVHSTVLRMTVAPRFQELQVAPKEFIQFLKTAFAMKRKTLVNNLKTAYEEARIKAALKQAGARADVRAEAMGLEQMAAVFKDLVIG